MESKWKDGRPKLEDAGCGPEGELPKEKYICQEEQPANKGRARSEGRGEERKQEQRVASVGCSGHKFNKTGREIAIFNYLQWMS